MDNAGQMWRRHLKFARVAQILDETEESSFCWSGCLGSNARESQLLFALSLLNVAKLGKDVGSQSSTR